MDPLEPDDSGPGAESSLFRDTPYCLIRRLRAGGMGEVFAVAHRKTGRQLVAKLLHERFVSDARSIERMRIEAEALGQLDHAHIVKIVGFDKTHTRRPFIVMEYLRGTSLGDELASRHTLSVYEALTFTCEILSALEAAHEIGIVHRDIKPDNIFICRNGEDERFVKLLDFGVARVMPGTTAVAPLPDSLSTETGTVLGTARFVSPEQAMGARVDQRADLYAVALVLYEMLVGRGPFDHFHGDSYLLTAHAVEDPEPPSHFAKGPVSPELDHTVMKALAKDPALRFQTASEFREVLGNIATRLRQPSGWLATTALRPALREFSTEKQQRRATREPTIIGQSPRVTGEPARLIDASFEQPFDAAQQARANQPGVLELMRQTGLPLPAALLLAALVMLIAAAGAIRLVSALHGVG